MMILKKYLILISLLSVNGCATFSGHIDPRLGAFEIAQKSGFEREYVQAGRFTLTVFSRMSQPGKPVNIYIEGDGRAFLSKTRLSGDPTPFHHMVLTLATLDSSANTAYIARPYQYGEKAPGTENSPYWADKRFSEEVLHSVDEAVNFLAQKSRSSEVNLVGYSGGGAIAVLLAARRTDVKTMRTIAGNLDPISVNRYHGVEPLRSSLDPLQVAPKTASIPQIHFIGTEDKIISPAIVQNFIRASGDSRCIRVIPVEGAGHDDRWVAKWRKLLEISVSCD